MLGFDLRGFPFLLTSSDFHVCKLHRNALDCDWHIVLLSGLLLTRFVITPTLLWDLLNELFSSGTSERLFTEFRS